MTIRKIDALTGNYNCFEDEATLRTVIHQSLEEDLSTEIANKKTEEILNNYVLPTSNNSVFVINNVEDEITVVNISDKTIKEAGIECYLPIPSAGKVTENLNEKVRKAYSSYFDFSGNVDKELKSFVINEEGNVYMVQNESSIVYNLEFYILPYYLSVGAIGKFKQDFIKAFVPDHLFEIIDERTNERLFYINRGKFIKFEVTEEKLKDILRGYFENAPEYLDQLVYFIMLYFDGKSDMKTIETRIKNSFEDVEQL